MSITKTRTTSFSEFMAVKMGEKKLYRIYPGSGVMG
jgi:hypothetical protein